ncbi:diguanylate cyclase [Luteimonas mephitis]|uniref:sensor domain-containing diguanylate cyclase n=1 Tax=Luteimonas mephitis TaxID=83615 RepID=UPI003A923B3C
MQTVKERTRFGLLFAALIFIGIGAGILYGAQRLIGDARSVAHSNEVMGRLDELEARLRDAESAQRGYILSGRADYLADYHNSRERVPVLVDGIDALVVDNQAQVRRARQLRAKIETRLHQITNTLLRYESDGIPGARAAMDSDVFETSSAIRRLKAQMVDAERALLEQRAASTRGSANVLRAIALLGIPLGLAVTLGVYLLLVREIRRRSDAEAAAREVQGQLREGNAELQHKSADLRALSRYGGMLQGCLDADEALQLTSRMLSTLRPGTAGTIYRMRNSQDHAEAAIHWGRHRAASAESLLPDACWGLRRNQPHLVSDVSASRCSHVSAVDHDGVAIACIPLMAQGAQIGLLYLSDDDDGFLSRIDIIEAVAEQLSMALSNLSLRERLRLQSIREPLTGLFNRRYLEESATRELARCARRELPLSLMMLDIDHFKAFNDVHGHAGGDALLAAFGTLLAEHSRGEDIACRYGGEEFTLILPEAPVDAALQRAEAIRAAVETMRVQHMGRELPRVTVSIGVAAFPAHGDSPESLLRVADEALYRAKHNGRNRVECA